MFVPIPGYENLYLINEIGFIYSLTKERLLKPFISNGYYNIKLYKDKVKQNYKVHRLVALVFVEGYFEGAHVNHIDFNSFNNAYSNLEWLPQQDNLKHSFKRSLQVKAKYYIITYPGGKEENIFNLSEFCRDNGLNQGYMTEVASGKRKQHKGFKCIKLGGV